MSANYIPFFETTLLEAACSRIPQTKPFHKISIPLWKKDCEVAVKNKKHALNRARRTRSPLDILIFKRCRAKEGKVILEAKHSTWRSYCTSINSNTKLSTVWTTIKNFSGSLSYTRIPQLENNGIVASNDQHKANMLGNQSETVSSSTDLPTAFTRNLQNFAQGYLGVSRYP